MSDRRRNSIYIGVMLGLVIALMVGLVPRGLHEESADERVHRIASNLRCPFCNGESIADAQSAIADDLRHLIREQVSAGVSDGEITQFFVDRYSDRILLTPPWWGWGLLLWLLPLTAAGVGASLIWKRRRFSKPHRVLTPRKRIDAAEAAQRDLVELDLQVATGELDPVEAAMLRRRYEDEINTIDETTIYEGQAANGWKRRALGAAIVLGGAAALTVGVFVTIKDRAPGELPTGGVASPDRVVDLNLVTNEEMEAVVAAAPGVVPMRLALAGRYFNSADFSEALKHYMTVLDSQRHPEALANVGWMTFLSGEPETARRLVEESLLITQQLPQAHWYIANILYRGFGDAAGALEPLDKLLAMENIPADVRQLAEEFRATVWAEQ